MSGCHDSALPWPVAVGSVEMKPLVVQCWVGVEVVFLEPAEKSAQDNGGRMVRASAEFPQLLRLSTIHSTNIDQLQRSPSLSCIQFFDILIRALVERAKPQLAQNQRKTTPSAAPKATQLNAPNTTTPTLQPLHKNTPPMARASIHSSGSGASDGWRRRQDCMPR